MISHVGLPFSDDLGTQRLMKFLIEFLDVKKSLRLRMMVIKYT